MDYNYNNNLTRIHPNPTSYPNPPSRPDPYSSILHQQPVPHNPNTYSSSYTINYNLGHEAQQQNLIYSYGHTNNINAIASSGEAITSLYYQDPNLVQNLGTIQPFSVTEVAAVSLNGAKKYTPANVNSTFHIQPLRSGSWKKGKKKSKIQPVWCEICKLEFNSKTILDQHKLGRRHKRSLENLNGCGITAAPISAHLVASEVLVNPFLGAQEKPDKVNSANKQDAGKKAVKPVENLETKTRKVLEGGAATDEVRICPACNVVCNSETVFQTHLTGKRHIANMTKQEKFTPASASLVPSEVSVNTFIGPQEKPGKVNLGNVQDAVKKAAELMENLETKRRKVLEGGAATNEVRMCHACNVVCNSETVFRTHLTGKKHIANMKKQASGAGVASAN